MMSEALQKKKWEGNAARTSGVELHAQRDRQGLAQLAFLESYLESQLRYEDLIIKCHLW